MGDISLDIKSNALNFNLNSNREISDDSTARYKKKEDLKSKYYEIGTMKRLISYNLSRIFTFEYIKKLIPIISWLPSYKVKKWLLNDLIAGITVGCLIVPQSLGNADLIGIPTVYGLYSAFIGSLVYLIFGTSRELNLGPVTLVAVIIRKMLSNLHPQLHVNMCFLVSFITGVVLLGARILKLSFLINLLSVPVISGFTSAGAITGTILQINGLFGYSINRTEGLFDSAKNIAINLPKARYQDCIVGLICLFLLTLIKYIPNIINHFKPNYLTTKRTIDFALKTFVSLRYGLIIILATILSYCLYFFESKFTLRLIGPMPSGVQTFHNPFTEITYIENNSTIRVSVLKQFELIGFNGLIVALVGYLESIALAKSFARMNGYKVSSGQEMVAIGMANIMSSFFQSYPSVGSFSRTALNNQCGVKTPLSSLFMSILVIVCLLKLTPAFAFIPKCSMSAMMIAAVVPLIDYHIVIQLFKTKRWMDLFILTITFGICLYNIEIGLIVGISLHVLSLVIPYLKPKILSSITINHEDTTYLIPQNTTSIGTVKLSWKWLTYASCQKLVSKIEKIIIQSINKNDETIKEKVIILDLTEITYIDYSACQSLKELNEYCLKQKTNPKLIIILTHEQMDIFKQICFYNIQIINL